MVEEALRLIARTVQITYSLPAERAGAGAGAEWAQSLRHFDEQLNRPAWEDDHVPATGGAPPHDSLHTPRRDDLRAATSKDGEERP